MRFAKDSGHHNLDNDPALTLMARIVRGADTGRPELSSETAGVQAILEGLRTQHYPDDHAQREERFAAEAPFRWACSRPVDLHCPSQRPERGLVKEDHLSF